MTEMMTVVFTRVVAGFAQGRSQKAEARLKARVPVGYDTEAAVLDAEIEPPRMFLTPQPEPIQILDHGMTLLDRTTPCTTTRVERILLTAPPPDLTLDGVAGLLSVSVAAEMTVRPFQGQGGLRASLMRTSNHFPAALPRLTQVKP